jgi:hypothetical protein
MEPLHPDLRAALKRAHPGLTDEDIDRSEELLNERMNTDPQADPERIARLDAEREELIRGAMPRYAEVVQVVKAEQLAAQGAAAAREETERVRVTLRKPPAGKRKPTSGS